MPDSQESEELLSDTPEPCDGPLEDVEVTPAARTTHETKGIKQKYKIGGLGVELHHVNLAVCTGTHSMLYFSNLLQHIIT